MKWSRFDSDELIPTSRNYEDARPSAEAKCRAGLVCFQAIRLAGDLAETIPIFSSPSGRVPRYSEISRGMTVAELTKWRTMLRLRIKTHETPP